MPEQRRFDRITFDPRMSGTPRMATRPSSCTAVSNRFLCRKRGSAKKTALAYGRADWMTELIAESDRARLEALIAWGKPVLLDTSYTAEEADQGQPPLAQLRADLVAEYPPVGPIFA